VERERKNMLKRLFRVFRMLFIGEKEILTGEDKTRIACLSLIASEEVCDSADIKEELFVREIECYDCKFLIFSDFEKAWIVKTTLGGDVLKSVETELYKFAQYNDPFPFARKPLRNTTYVLESDDSLYMCCLKIKGAWKASGCAA
jgi:hypothetical protein